MLAGGQKERDMLDATIEPRADAGKRFGRLVFRRALPDAIRSLENDELRILLAALLQEWRSRTEAADEMLMRMRPQRRQD